jgi:hypothetical protein
MTESIANPLYHRDGIARRKSMKRGVTDFGGSASALTLSRFHGAMDSDRHSGRVRLLTTYSGGDHAICS